MIGNNIVSIFSGDGCEVGTTDCGDEIGEAIFIITGEIGGEQAVTISAGGDRDGGGNTGDNACGNSGNAAGNVAILGLAIIAGYVGTNGGGLFCE